MSGCLRRCRDPDCTLGVRLLETGTDLATAKQLARHASVETGADDDEVQLLVGLR